MAQLKRINSQSQDQIPPAAVPDFVVQGARQKGVDVDLSQILYGGFCSAIYKGTMNGQQIAVKLLCSDFIRSSGRFGEQEGEMIVRWQLKDVPGVVKTLMYPFLVHQQQFWYVYPMQLGRETWADYLKRKPERRMKEGKAKNVVRQVASALQYMHSKEIAHMKVSLWAIMFDAADKHKVFLVGLGQTKRKMARRPLNDLPHSGYMTYWPPDIVPMVPHPDGKYDPYKADTWALGYCLFQALTGTTLWLPNADKESLVWKGHHMISKKIEDWNRNHPESHPSDVAMDLLMKMMYYFEGARLSMYHVLQHEWFKGQS